MIIELDMYSEIRSRCSNGEFVRGIANGLKISRQTVEKYCEGSTHPEVRKVYQRESEIIINVIKKFI